MNQPLDILMVDDSVDDAELVKRALKKKNLGNNILHLQDGQDALDFLFDPANELPKVILLDLKMPRVDGIEVLRMLKGDEKRKVVPVVMLTSSKEERDIVETYQLGVNAYVVKPVDFDNFVDALTQLGLFWLIHNQPPQVNRQVQTP